MNTDSFLSELRGQVAVVTGAGRGIGRATALALGRAGAAVGAVARSEEQIAETARGIKEAGGAAMAVTADVSDAASVERMARQVESALGPADLLVNNAAAMGPLGPLWEVDSAAWWHTLEVNLRGPFLCARAFLPGMVARRRGRIINLATSAATVAVAHMSAYVVAKTALIRLSENLAAELVNSGVQVFAVDPGTVRTAMSGFVLESEAGQKWLPWFRKLFDRGRDVPPEKAAQLVVQLAAGRADALSGRFLGVADDLEKLPGQAGEIKSGDLYALRVRKL